MQKYLYLILIKISIKVSLKFSILSIKTMRSKLSVGCYTMPAISIGEAIIGGDMSLKNVT